MALIGGFVTKAAFSFKSKGTEKIQLFSQETDDPINLKYESLITVDYKYNEFPVLHSWM